MYLFSRSRSAALASTLVGHGGLRDGTVYGWDAEVEQVGSVLGGPVEHVTQNQGGPLLRCEEHDQNETRSGHPFHFAELFLAEELKDS